MMKLIAVAMVIVMLAIHIWDLYIWNLYSKKTTKTSWEIFVGVELLAIVIALVILLLCKGTASDQSSPEIWFCIAVLLLTSGLRFVGVLRMKGKIE